MRRLALGFAVAASATALLVAVLFSLWPAIGQAPWEAGDPQGSSRSGNYPPAGGDLRTAEQQDRVATMEANVKARDCIAWRSLLTKTPSFTILFPTGPYDFFKIDLDTIRWARGCGVADDELHAAASRVASRWLAGQEGVPEELVLLLREPTAGWIAGETASERTAALNEMVATITLYYGTQPPPRITFVVPTGRSSIEPPAPSLNDTLLESADLQRLRREVDDLNLRIDRLR